MTTKIRTQNSRKKNKQEKFSKQKQVLQQHNICESSLYFAIAAVLLPGKKKKFIKHFFNDVKINYILKENEVK